VARESFLLRTDPRVLDALRRWADDELRSVNAQVDFLLRKALKDAGRWKEADEGKSRKGTGGKGGERVQ
jgi:hypothetical protein